MLGLICYNIQQLLFEFPLFEQQQNSTIIIRTTIIQQLPPKRPFPGLEQQLLFIINTSLNFSFYLSEIISCGIFVLKHRYQSIQLNPVKLFCFLTSSS